MILTQNDKFIIILSAIRNYRKNQDIFTLIVEETCRTIPKHVNELITTQDIYDVIVDCFDMYNDYIIEKKVDLPSIPDGAYDLVLVYLNDLVEELR